MPASREWKRKKQALNPKKIAAEDATRFIEEGMILGLGSGTTMLFAIRKVGELVRRGLKITAVPTSNSTAGLIRSLGIPGADIDDVPAIDLTIDGADEIDGKGNGIKGGRGALLYEKIVAANSKRNIWVVEGYKLVERLGKFPLPVEVVPFGHKKTWAILREKGYEPVLRQEKGKIFITDSGHYILDLHLGTIAEPGRLSQELKMIPGVIEHGLFLNTPDKAVVGNGSGVRVIDFK